MIIGFNYRKMNIERKKKLVQGMKVSYDLDIANMYVEDFPLTDKTQMVLSLDFDFSVKYNPDVAVIDISGTVNYMVSQEEGKKIMALWEKTKKLPKSLSVPVINRILDKCNIKALELEQDLSLPTHLPMPSVNISGMEKKDDGKEANKHVG